MTWSLYSSALAAELEELELAAWSMEGSTCHHISGVAPKRSAMKTTPRGPFPNPPTSRWLPSSLISKSFWKGTSAWHQHVKSVTRTLWVAHIAHTIASATTFHCLGPNPLSVSQCQKSVLDHPAKSFQMRLDVSSFSKILLILDMF